MNLKLIEKQLEILEDIVFNIQCAESRLEETIKWNTSQISIWLYTEKKRTHNIEIMEKALMRWKLRYLREVDTLDNLNNGIKVDTAKERF